MANKSGVAEQVLSLPKGGGAIKGIGETFQPNLFTGTGNFSIPIATSPGRNAFGPQLSLQYSSGKGNGPFGIGWQLSIPRITRKTEKSLPTYTDKDVFVISGAEDLVPYLDNNGDPVAVPGHDGYSITRYRPRTEGLFSRIEKWLRQSDGDVHWRVTTKENITSIYGKSDAARLIDPAKTLHIFEWLLEETFDAKGNHIFYEHIKENANLRIPEIYEENRQYNQSYIRRILYGNTPESLDNSKKVGPKRTGTHHSNPTGTLARHYIFEVLLDYEDLPDLPVIPFDPAQFPDKPSPEEWPVREDPLSSFRAGFEIRTLRRCKRVLMLHHFKEGALEGAPLVKSTNFEYSHNNDSRLSMLTAVKVTGYRKDPQDGTKYVYRDMPPVSFKYSEFKPQEQHYQSVTANCNDLPPKALNDPNFTLMDLFGNGLPDILNTNTTGYYFWQNLGDGHVARRHPQHEFPANVILSDSNVAIGDMGGDGLPDLVVEARSMSGFYEGRPDGKWKPFKRFDTMPSFSLSDPNVRLVDLTGDGLSDVLMTSEHHFLWYKCLGEQGYDEPKVVEREHDLNEFPDVYFNDPSGRVRLADMTGDGLNDIVLVHNGRIDYWPNLGYGKFGKRITMANAARLDYNFNPQRLFLVDLDGTGCADLVYVDFDRVNFWFNQSGNSWSDQQIIHGTPSISDSSAIQFADFFGTGTATLVWSYDYNFQPGSNYKVLDFCGGVKPFLLVEMDNNMGATTRVKYAPSTKFYLEDKNAGTPWVTSLPFPVQALEKTEVIDHISKTKLVTTYKYHHGYYDGREREFRGFGRVDQYDTETFEAFANHGLHEGESLFSNNEAAHYLPPVLTKNWFHTGVYFDENLPSSSGVFYDKQDMMSAYREEFYQGDTSAFALEDHAVQIDGTPHEAYRALRGSLLRSEVYALDGTDKAKHPYTVSENRYEIKQLQTAVKEGLRITQHGVYLTVQSERINYYYERNPIDPRISHSIVLETDELSNPIRTASVVYGRRIVDSTLPSEVTDNQQQMYITYGEVDYTADIALDNPTPAYRLRVPCESRSYEITGIAPASDLFNLVELNNKIAGTADIPYEIMADGVTPQKRLLSQSRTIFLDDNLNPMPLGQWDTLGLSYQSYQLAFTPTITGAHYAGKVTDADFSAAGYLHFDGDANWWIPSITSIYPANPAEHFYVSIGKRDPLGIETIVTFDQYDLLVERRQVRQAAWNETIATNDYRVLGPVKVIDPNKNRVEVEIDELGMVLKTAITGKAAGPAEGDTLADPTVRMEYELFNWINHRKPNFVHTFAREQHGAANPRWQESYDYSNGSGGVAMVKAQAHPGKALQVNAGGTVTEVDADPRWVGSGRMILNNKANPVKQYEPYFSSTHDYEDEKLLREIGVTPILYYDAAGRNICTKFPNGTFARVEFDPWMQKVFDANDTVRESQWYADRGSPDPATQPEPVNDPEHRAAWLTAKHADTPGITHFDSLGRPIYAISDYGGGKTASVRSESDLTGRFTKMFDQHQREVASGFDNMAGHPIVGENAEKGRRWTFQNVLGAEVKTWDEHGREFRVEYDQLQRPLSTFVQETGQAEILFNYVVYGDRHPNVDQLNLLGIPHLIFDQAGMVRIPELDFKGNPKRVERVLARDYKNKLDWAPLAGQPDLAAIQAAADLALEIGEVFSASSQYDALNRPIQATLPDNTVILPTYNEANFLASLKAQIRGQGNFIEFLKAQDYDAKGQRQFAHYGNDVFTRYFYDRNTFRLSNLLTYNSGDDPNNDSLQDLHYAYDPVGNITQIHDDAQQTHYFNNAVVKQESLYEYDSIYQLIRATGREQAGLTNSEIRTHGDLDFLPQLPHANNADAVRTYTEKYEYDLLGNIKVLRHHFKPQPGIGNGWTRHYRYAYEDDAANRTNRLSATSQPGDPDNGPYTATYDYDAYGNMTQMPRLASMDWNFMDQLRQVDLGGGGTAYYVYDFGGQRLRKVIERNGNTNIEWIFLCPVMIFRRKRRNTNAPRLERWTVNISDNTGHIAQVDTKTRDDDNSDPANPLNTPLIRYQYANHLGSAVLETDEQGNPISYEEYHPYGTSAYRSAKPGFDLSLKRYRFSGKERDDETGLYYFGARNYAPWLGRWTSSDPVGFARGFNLYKYCRNNPIVFNDPKGTDERVALNPENEHLADPSKKAEAKNYLQQQYTSRLKDQKKRFIIDEMHFTESGFWSVDKWHLASKENAEAGTGAVASQTGRATIKKNPPGFTKELPNNADPEKLRDYKKAIQNKRSVGINPDSTTQQRAQRTAGGGARDSFVDANPRPPNSEAPSGNWDVDHRIEIQDDISGRSGLNTDDYRYQDRSLNRSQGATNRWRKVGQLDQGIAAGEPAGGVARTRDMGKFWNKQGFRTTMRYGGYGLVAGGTIYSAYAFSQDVEEGNWFAASLSGTGFAGGGLTLGGTAVGSTTLVTAGTVIGAPAAVIGSGILGWQIGTYTNENTAISDVAMAGGDFVYNLTGSETAGALGAAVTAIYTAPIFVPIAVAKGIGSGASWVWNKIF